MTEGLFIVHDWFASRGHEVLIILPQSRKSKLMAKGRKEEVAKLDNLEKSGILFYSPSRRTNTRSWDCYNDIFIVDIAARKQGIVVSNDNYRDVLKLRNEEFNEQIKNRYIQIVVSLIRFYILITTRTLGFMLCGGMFIPPQDPLGKIGPRLEEFLRF